MSFLSVTTVRRLIAPTPMTVDSTMREPTYPREMASLWRLRIVYITTAVQTFAFIKRISSSAEWLIF